MDRMNYRSSVRRFYHQVGLGREASYAFWFLRQTSATDYKGKALTKEEGREGFFE